MAALAGMSIAKQDVLADIPESELLSLLILRTSNVRMLDLLDIEAGRFNGDAENGQHPADICNNTEMRDNLILNARSQPAFLLVAYTVQKTCFAIACFAVPAGTTKFALGR